MNEDQIDWNEEAKGVIADICGNVSLVFISTSLKPPIPEGVYLNLKTLENKEFTIKVDSRGFSIVGTSFDQNIQEPGVTSFETVYALLQSISPKYVSSFAGELQTKLAALKKSSEPRQNLKY